MGILRKSLLFIIIFNVFVHATTLNSVKNQVLYNISHLLTNKENIKIYINDKQFDYFKKFEDKLIRVPNCNDAEIILTNNTSDLPEECIHKIIICTSFDTFKNDENVTGAIFWQKGRVNIIFRKSNIEKFSIKINKTLERYLY
jgi:hypothetical protein